MCINKRWIVNSYTHKRILVKCGRCPACLAEKARHRAGRIKNNIYKGQVSLFCTLTYANEFIPYIPVSELLCKQKVVHVYRDAFVRRVRVSGSYQMKYKIFNEKRLLDTFYVGEDLYKCDSSFPRCFHKPNAVGVCYYKDIQDFFKRLDINLKRRYGFKGKYHRFACHEYGTKGKRPHFHLVIFCDSVDMQAITSAIHEAWPYDRGLVRHRKCELTRGSVANYVASYVNSFAAFHPLLSSPSFRSRCSYSRGFGLAPVDFNVDSIVSKASQGNLDWSFETLRDRVPTVIDVSIPKYVINRYFPKFKGYSRLACNQILDVLQNPRRLANYVRILDYDLMDLHREIVKLTNACMRYPYPKRFAHDYLLVWSVFTRSKLRKFYESLTGSAYDYDNIEILKFRPHLSRSLLPLLMRLDLDKLNPNTFPYNVKEHNLLLEEFHNRQKHRDINAVFFEHNNYEQLI